MNISALWCRGSVGPDSSETRWANRRACLISAFARTEFENEFYRSDVYTIIQYACIIMYLAVQGRTGKAYSTPVASRTRFRGLVADRSTARARPVLVRLTVLQPEHDQGPKLTLV